MKRAVVVVGMHRSGTSAVAQCVESMGASFAPPGLAFSRAEESGSGILERQDVVALNDYALALAGAGWRNVSAFEPARVPADQVSGLDGAIRQLVSNLDQLAPWMVKDPRLCLTLPLWRPHLRDPVYVLVVRDPAQVARSLAMRDGLPLPVGLALWERYNLSALGAISGSICVTISYERLMADPRAVVSWLYRDLRDAAVDGLVEPTSTQIDRLVRPGLFHQRQTLGTEGTCFQRSLWDCLQAGDLDGAKALSGDRSDATLARFDSECGTRIESKTVHDLERQLAVWLDIGQRLASPDDDAFPRLVREYVQLRAHRDGLLAELDLRSGVIASVQSENERLHGALGDLEHRVERSQLTLDTARTESEQARRRSEVLRREGLRTRYALDSLRSRRSVRWALAADRATVDSVMGVRLLGALKEVRGGWRYLKTHGVRGFVRRFDEVVLKRSHAGALPAKPLPQERNPGDIQIILDSIQGEEIRASGSLDLAGRVIARGGLRDARVLINGRDGSSLVRITERLDVLQANPELTDTPGSRFEQRVDLAELAPGEYRLSLVARSNLGATRVLNLRLTVEGSRERWHRLFHRRQPDLSECAVLAESMQDWDRRPRILVVVSCREGFPEPLLDDLREQILAPDRVCLLPGERRGTAGDLAWKLPAWAGLQKVVPFRLDVALPGQDLDSLAAGCDLVAMLEAGERLTRDALFRMAAEMRDGDADLVYCDHDQIGEDYLHANPDLKPDWSPQLLLARDYIGGCALLGVGRLDPAIVAGHADPIWRYRQVLAATLRDARVRHVPRVLWSKRVSEAGEALEAEALVRAMVADADPAAEVRVDPETGDRRIRWGLPDRPPKVSVIIPTTGRLEFLGPCVRTLTELTDYPDFETIFLDNGRGRYPEGIAWLRERGPKVIECNEPFNWSRLNNLGARVAVGEYLLFLNDDIEITDPDWLGWLVSHASRPGIGCVGALLYYPSGEIQHDGLFLVDHGGGVRHWFHHMAPSAGIYRRLDRVTREVSVVTGACLLVSAALFRELGGFDEEFVVTHNDVDFCLRAAAAGRRNLVVADTSLIHHESVHRGNRSSPNEDRRILALWGDTLKMGDRYHNPQFVKTGPDCAIDYRVEDAPAAAGPAADGVNCVAYVSAEMGLGEAARGILASLESAGVPVDAIDYRRGNPARCGDRRWCHRVAGTGRYRISIYIINADWLPSVKPDVQPQLARERYAIGYWAWELSDFPPRWQGAFDLVDEIWVASAHVREGVERLTDKPVFVVPYSVAVDGIGLPGRDRFGLPADRFIFLTLFDVNSVMARKNPLGAIDAFDQAFDAANDRVHLAVKVNNADGATLNLLDRRLRGRSNVTVLDGTLSRREINGLFDCCDALVSLHRAEGFGLPPAEAMSLGRAAIATGYSGNLDFMNDSNSILVPYRLAKIGAGQGPYDAESLWAEPDIAAAAVAMRQIFQEPGRYEAMTRNAWISVRAQLAPRQVGQWLRAHLEALGRRL